MALIWKENQTCVMTSLEAFPCRRCAEEMRQLGQFRVEGSKLVTLPDGRTFVFSLSVEDSEPRLRTVSVNASVLHPDGEGFWQHLPADFHFAGAEGIDGRMAWLKRHE